MRSVTLLALLLPAFLLPVACESDPSSPAPNFFQPDTGTAVFDGGQPIDGAPPGDATTDAPVLPTTITVLRAGAPLADVRVLFHDATGAVTADLKTDAAGKVTAVAAPNMVTVLTNSPSSFGGGPAAVTYLGVAGGDSLTVAIPDDFLAEPPSIGSYTVSFTAGFGGATNYEVSANGGCFGSTVDPAIAAGITLHNGCVQTTNAVLATATEVSGPLAFAFAKNVAKPAAGGNVDVGPLTFAARGTALITATNLPPNTNTTTEQYAVVNGKSFFTGGGSGAIDDGGISHAFPVGFGDAIQTYIDAATGGGTRSVRAFVRREAPPAGATPAFAFDFANALPAITQVTATAVARPDVAITAASPLTGADGGVVRIRWFAGGPGAATARWTFVVPPGTTTFKAPSLPTDAPTFVPSNSVNVETSAFFEATQVPSYAAVKLLPIDPTGSYGAFALLHSGTALPTNGTVRLTTFDPND